MRILLGMLGGVVVYVALVTTNVNHGLYDLVRAVSEPRATELSGSIDVMGTITRRKQDSDGKEITATYTQQGTETYAEFLDRVESEWAALCARSW